MRTTIAMTLLVILLGCAAAQPKNDEYRSFNSQYGAYDIGMTNSCMAHGFREDGPVCVAYAERKSYLDRTCTEIFQARGFNASQRCGRHRDYCSNQKNVAHLNSCFAELDGWIARMIPPYQRFQEAGDTGMTNGCKVDKKRATSFVCVEWAKREPYYFEQCNDAKGQQGIRGYATCFRHATYCANQHTVAKLEKCFAQLDNWLAKTLVD